MDAITAVATLCRFTDIVDALVADPAAFQELLLRKKAHREARAAFKGSPERDAFAIGQRDFFDRLMQPEVSARLDAEIERMNDQRCRHPAYRVLRQQARSTRTVVRDMRN